jgi:hypothetical protein
MRPSDTTHGEPYKRIIGVIIGGERFSLSSLSAYRISDQSSGLRRARRVRAGPALLHTPRYRVIRVSVQTFQEKSSCSPYLGALINVECAQCIYKTCHVAY